MIPDRGEERGAQATPRLALRVAVIGTCALVLFAIVFFRLWYLQVLSGAKFAAKANTNSVKTVPVQGPRGEILDRGGSVMVGSRLVPVVQVAPSDLPKPVSIADRDILRRGPHHTTVNAQPRADMVLYRNLAKAIGISNKPEKCTVTKYTGHPDNPTVVHHLMLSEIACLVATGVSEGSVGPVTIKTDVSNAVRGYLLEEQRQFPGVIVQQSSLRQYSDGDTAAQLFGTIGPIPPTETKAQQFKGVPSTDTVGQSGLEFEYNQYLQGHDGSEKVTVNAAGQILHTRPGRAPAPGENLQLSIDLGLQRVGEQALATSIASNPGSDGGAFVALDPTNGQVLAMGSNPTFNPSVFTHPLSRAKYNRLFGADSGSPLLNRAIQTAGPTGSTFKVITATAALQSGKWSPDQVWDDTGEFCFPHTTDCIHNSGMASYGAVNLVQAIQFSVDTFFDNLGLLTNVDVPQGGPLQQWAKLYGIGRPTGIDLPGAVAGTRPSPGWRTRRNREEEQCDTATGSYAYTNGTNHSAHPHGAGWHRSPKHSASEGGCGITNGAPWTEGDNVNMATGQGDVQVTPLQLAVVYAALANGGTIVTPHVGEDIQASDGTVVQKIDPPAKRHLDIDPGYLDEILQGLRDAASQPGGTSADVMGNFPEQVYAKTGTAEFSGQPDYAWYACFVPASATSKPIVIVTTVERGGFGDVAAAPIAREMLGQWFFGKPGKYVSGTSTTL